MNKVEKASWNPSVAPRTGAWIETPFDPWLTGRDLIEAGVKPSPKLGKLLRTLYTRQLEGDDPSREAQLLWFKTLQKSRRD